MGGMDVVAVWAAFAGEAIKRNDLKPIAILYS